MKFILISLLVTLNAFASELNEEIKTLDLTQGQAPAAVQNETYYSVQERMYPLTKKIELSLQGTDQIGGESFLQTRQLQIGVGYHFNNKWSVHLAHTKVSNSFTAAADQLYKSDQIYPDVAYVKSRNEIAGYYNLLYGKFRFGREQVYYFDQYFGLGYTQNDMNREKNTGYMGDVGMAFWIPPYGGAKVGFKDYYQKEKKLTSSKAAHNLSAYVGYSYLF